MVKACSGRSAEWVGLYARNSAAYHSRVLSVDSDRAASFRGSPSYNRQSIYKTVKDQWPKISSVNSQTNEKKLVKTLTCSCSCDYRVYGIRVIP